MMYLQQYYSENKMTVAELRALLETVPDDSYVFIDIDGVEMSIKGTGKKKILENEYLLLIPHTDFHDELKRQQFRELRDKIYSLLDEYSKEYRQRSRRCLVDITDLSIDNKTKK